MLFEGILPIATQVHGFSLRARGERRARPPSRDWREVRAQLVAGRRHLGGDVFRHVDAVFGCILDCWVGGFCKSKVLLNFLRDIKITYIRSTEFFCISSFQFLVSNLPIFGVVKDFELPEFYPLLWDSLKFHDQMCPDSGVIGLHFQDLPVGTYTIWKMYVCPIYVYI